MVQWINILWNNSFINPMQLPLLHEKLDPSHSGTESYGRQASRPLSRRNCCKVNSVYLTFKCILGI